MYKGYLFADDYFTRGDGKYWQYREVHDEVTCVGPCLFYVRESEKQWQIYVVAPFGDSPPSLSVDIAAANAMHIGVWL